MGESAIVTKLRKLLAAGISSEPDALYLLVELRKLVEHRSLKTQYEYLTFHCDWAVHTRLKGPMAQRILASFDAAAIHLEKGIELNDLPASLREEIVRISQMRHFEREMNSFLQANDLPTLDDSKPDGWVRFLYHYARIVEDCPLLIVQGNTGVIARVTIKMQTANRDLNGEVFFKVSWVVEDKNGKTGEIFVINSFPADRSAPQTAQPDRPTVEQ